MLTLKSNARPRRRGATVVVIAILLPVLLAMVAFAVEIGRMYLVRSQLQTAVDAGALAAGLKLREKPDDLNEAVKKGLKFAQLNHAGAFVDIPKEAITIEAGKWDTRTRTFTPGSITPDAIQVSGNLDQEPLFFAKAMGLHTFAMPRSAIAIAGGNSSGYRDGSGFVGIHGLPGPNPSSPRCSTGICQDSKRRG